MDTSVQSGIWYLQRSYDSAQIAYAYGIHGFFHRVGNVFRVDVLTSETRPAILCCGDSITHGYKSTLKAGKAYPEILENLTSRPTLNLGVKGDLLTQMSNISTCTNGCKTM